MVTLISHFFNEEYTLVWWLRNHVPLFDHGILLNNHSTDASVEIIRELAPTWEVVNSRFDQFEARLVDQELVEIEHRVDGWKIVLTHAEYLLTPNLRSYISKFECDHPSALGMAMHSYVIVDTPEQRLIQPHRGRSLIAQRCNGFLAPDIRRCRFLHKAYDGDYDIGRHYTHLPNIVDVDDLRLAWFGYSPMTVEGVKRKLQIQDNMSDYDKINRYGWEHVVTPDGIEVNYQAHLARCQDLLLDPYYREIYKYLGGVCPR